MSPSYMKAAQLDETPGWQQCSHVIPIVLLVCLVENALETRSPSTGLAAAGVSHSSP